MHKSTFLVFFFFGVFGGKSEGFFFSDLKAFLPPFSNSSLFSRILHVDLSERHKALAKLSDKFLSPYFKCLCVFKYQTANGHLLLKKLKTSILQDDTSLLLLILPPLFLPGAGYDKLSEKFPLPNFQSFKH